MSMRQKLNEVDEFFLLNNDMTVEQFSKKLNVKQDTIEQFLFNNKERILVAPTMLEWDKEKRLWRNPQTGEYFDGPQVNDHDTKHTVEVKQKIASGVKATDLLARNERFGAVVMTGAASEMGDHNRKTNKKEIDESKIFRPQN